MVYDAFGRMVEHYYGTTYTEPLITPIGNLGLMTTTNVSQLRIPLPGGATFASNNNELWHKDWLGSVRLVSTIGTRTARGDRAFAPYGETYDNFGASTSVNFTGDNQDLVSGTFDTPSRELNPNQGRWLSPDPARSLWNAYQYSTNPLTEKDASGLDAHDGNEDDWSPHDAGGFLMDRFFSRSAPTLGVSYLPPWSGSARASGDLIGSDIDVSYATSPVTSSFRAMWDTGILSMGFAPGNMEPPDTFAFDAMMLQQSIDNYNYCGMADCFVEPGPPRLRHAWQEPPNATIQQLKFTIPILNIPVTISDSFTIAYANASSTGDVSAVVGIDLIPSFGASFDISFDAPENPTPFATVGLGKNLGVGTLYYRPRPAGIPDQPRYQRRSASDSLHPYTMIYGHWAAHRNTE